MHLFISWEYINTALMLKRKKRQKQIKKPQHHRSEYNSYQPRNPLTQYVERVCGINSTEPKNTPIKSSPRKK